MVQSLPVSAQANGLLRGLWTKLAADAAKIEAAAAKISPSLLRDMQFKGAVGRDRALGRVLQHMKPAVPFFHTDRRALAYRYLKPCDEIPPAIELPPGDADRQPGILMCVVMFNGGGPRKQVRHFGACWSFHSLARVLDRSGFAACPIEEMVSGHDSLALLGPGDGQRVFEIERVAVPSTHGAFLASPRRVGADRSPLWVARTWLHADQLGADQDQAVAAWRKLVASP